MKHARWRSSSSAGRVLPTEAVSAVPRRSRARARVRVRPQIPLACFALAACGGPQSTTSSPSCPRDRTVVLADQADVDRLAGCETLTSVEIRTGAPLSLGALRSLEVITGDLVVGPTVALEELSVLELREIGGTLQVASNAMLRGLFLPRLERAGRVAIEANAALATVSLPRLETVTGSLLVTEDGSLELLTLSALRRVGKDLVITDNPKLALVEAGALSEVLEVRVERNRVLPADQVTALTAKASVPPAKTSQP